MEILDWGIFYDELRKKVIFKKCRGRKVLCLEI